LNPQPTIEATSATTDSSASVPLSSDAGLIDLSNAAQSDILDVIPNGDHIGDLASLGLARWTPTGLLQNLLEMMHVHLGLSWLAAIVICSIGLRLLVAPLIIKAQVNNLRLSAIRPEMEKHIEQLKTAKEAGDMQTAQKASIRAQKLLKDHDCHPLKGLIAPGVQIPLAIIFFTAINGMCKLPVESMTSGGALWFTDLTVADPTYVLPIVNVANAWMLIHVRLFPLLP
jgi:YidC/Oxa1 family membrane protein insertase